MNVDNEMRQWVFDRADSRIKSLREGLEASFDDLDTFQDWVDTRLRGLGASTKEFTPAKAEFTDQPALREQLESDPGGIQTGRNVVGQLPGSGQGTTLLFAHADKAPASYEHAAAGQGADFDGGRLSGPGIADDIAGVTIALGALETLAEKGWEPTRPVTVASVLGKQLGVAGTYGLMRRYGPADAAVYLHPAESGQGLADLKIGSNGLYEFVVTLEGEPPATNESHHPLYAHQGINPVDVVGMITEELSDWAAELAERHAHPGVERAAGRSAGLLTSDIRVDGEDRAVYEMPRRCHVRTLLAFPPGVTLGTVEDGVRRVVTSTTRDNGCPEASVRRGDHVAESAETPADSAVVRAATESIEAVTGRPPTPYYGHTASDIRYPLRYWDAPTVGFGPRAGAMGEPDEWIDREEYLEAVSVLAAFLVDHDSAPTADGPTGK